MAMEDAAVGGSPTGYGNRTLEDRGRDLGRKADELNARVQGGLRERVHNVSEAGHRVQERLGSAKDKVKGGVGRGRERVELEVQERPMRTLLIAVGVGALIGLLLSNSRSRR